MNTGVAPVGAAGSRMEVKEACASYVVEAGLRAPKGYKQTEVGVIPEDWEVIALGMVCTLHNGRAYALHEWETSGIPVIRLQNLTGGDDYYYSKLNLPDEKYCSQGDLLYMWSATFGPRIWTGDRAIYHYHIWKVTPHPTKAKADFLFHKLGDITLEKKTRAANGGTMLHVTKGDMEATLISLPTKAEQQAIAEALSDADALIESLEQLLAKKRQIKQGAMQELLTGKKRLPGFGGEWEICRLGEVAPLQRGFDLPNPQLQQGPYPVVYSNGILYHHIEYQVKGPGVVTGRSGTIGTVTFVEQNFWPHNTSLWVTSFKGNDPKFVYYLFTRIGLDRFATGSGVPTLNRNDVHAFKVGMPPTKAEQTAIATLLSDMDTELAALETKLAKARQIKQGMMQELLTGRIRLV